MTCECGSNCECEELRATVEKLTVRAAELEVQLLVLLAAINKRSDGEREISKQVVEAHGVLSRGQ